MHLARKKCRTREASRLGFGKHTERACNVKPKILGDAAAQALVDDHSVRGALPRQDDGLLFSAIQFEEDG